MSKIYKKNIYLLYEKDASRFEESASVLYERLIDEGYNNAYFILDCNSSHYSNINEKLNKNYSLSKKVLKSNFKEIYTLSNNGLSNELLYNQAKFTLLSYKIRRNKSSFSLRFIIKCQSNFNILLDKLRL